MVYIKNANICYSEAPFLDLGIKIEHQTSGMELHFQRDNSTVLVVWMSRPSSNIAWKIFCSAFGGKILRAALTISVKHFSKNLIMWYLQCIYVYVKYFKQLNKTGKLII